ncbi:Armadillo-type fold [Pseudocohnilembus persalinus]|uniref:Armadillo-type fold n=1 Tax=Pseudocohnilembus persalinus TaxID=266149 RepID=A0A0V0R556_PSEPJ|nr:Armadillo-type fold [Pseudocohnilembus persalinus]|eukprot:KRX09617.1 Armadillo-type fold [Pseudocohnilembus persalinus]
MNLDSKERQLIGNILDIGEEDDHLKLRNLMDQNNGLKSAPPGLFQSNFMQEFQEDQNEQDNEQYRTREYYEYYQKNHINNPRLKKPLYNPNYASNYGDILGLEFDRKLVIHEDEDKKMGQNQVEKQFSQFENNFGGGLKSGSSSNTGQNDNNFLSQEFQNNNSLSLMKNNSYSVTNTMGQQPLQQTPYQQSQFRNMQINQPPYNNQNGSNFFDMQSSQGQQGQIQQGQNFMGLGQRKQQFDHNFLDMQMQQNNNANKNYQQVNQLQQQPYNMQNFKNMNQGQQFNNMGQQQNFQMPQQMAQNGQYMNPQYMFPNQNMQQYYQNNMQNPQMNMQNQNMAQMGFMMQPNQMMNDYQQKGNYNQGNMQHYQNHNKQMNNNNYRNNMNNKNQQGGKGKFNNNFNKDMSFKELLENLIENCKDQYGSRQIQKQFETASDSEKNQLFQKIKPHILQLIKDQFGNYVIQRLLEKGNTYQKKEIFEQIKGNVCELSLHTYGCRVIQKALEEWKNDDQMQNQIIEEINQKIKQCITDQNGNHVIQKCFETTPPNKLTLIIQEVIQHIEELSTHSYGCRVIQRILEFCKPNQVEETKQIYDKLMDNLITLCECQYGNYIMQYILETGPDDKRSLILEKVKQNFVNLSIDKYASNVTEKSVQYSDEQFKSEVVDSLIIIDPITKESGFLKLTKDQFGNYVIQKLYLGSSDSTKKKISNYLKTEQVQQELMKNNFGKHVLQFLDKPQQATHHNNQNPHNNNNYNQQGNRYQKQSYNQ